MKLSLEEFRKIYNMRVVCVPPNRPIARVDALDYIYAHKGPKLKALVEEVKVRHSIGQPILIGTVSVESSEEISALLTEAGLHALDRNFSGLEDSNIKIKKIFKDSYKPNYDFRAELEKPFFSFGCD